MPPTAERRLILVLLALVAAAALLRPLAEPDEGRYGEAAREMLASGDLLLPRHAGVVYPDKPPGVYWAMAGAMAVLGPTAFAVRLPALLALGATVLLVRRRGRDRIGRAAGATAVLILVAEPLLLVLGQLATLDMVLTALVTAGLLAGRRLQRRGGAGPAAAAGAAFGAAFLVKGPVGPALALLVLLVTGLLERDGAALRRLLHPLLWLAMAAIGLPWYLAAGAAQPGLWEFWIGRETVGRIASDVHARARPIWFFPALAAAVLFPWWLGLLSSRRRRRLAVAGDARFHAVWALLPILFFSLPAGKQPAYLAPALPGLALWLGPAWAEPTDRRPRLVIGAAWAALALAGLILFLDPVRARSEDDTARVLRAAGAADWAGAQLMSWSYGLPFRLRRTDLECLGPPPKAWTFAAGRGLAPERSGRERAFARAVELLAGAQPAFVLVHDPDGDGRNRLELARALRDAGVAWSEPPTRSAARLFLNRPLASGLD
ncbi:MAG: phospholipid carrier-dependent glycosyltransferase [Planctomycetota bacterium]|nr:MAG: phospholipid carrier-dependent glycosyltransferase [Planctomycetota bacterium]